MTENQWEAKKFFLKVIEIRIIWLKMKETIYQWRITRWLVPFFPGKSQLKFWQLRSDIFCGFIYNKVRSLDLLKITANHILTVAAVPGKQGKQLLPQIFWIQYIKFPKNTIFKKVFPNPKTVPQTLYLLWLLIKI